MTDAPTERECEGAWARLRRRKVVQWGLGRRAMWTITRTVAVWRIRLTALCVTVGALVAGGCGSDNAADHAAKSSTRPTGDARVVNVYAWAGYFDPTMLERFTAETGIAVNYQPLESNDFLLTKLLTGNSGFDVVTPVDAVFGQEIRAGAFRKLDRAKISNWRHLNKEVLRRVARYDPGNVHGVPFLWGTDGIGYNEAMVRAVMPDAPVDSWRLVFDPSIAARFADCGIAIVDSNDVVWLARAYLGQRIEVHSEEDLKAAESLLLSIRPYVRMIDNARYKSALADGEICIAVGWSGDMQQAQARAEEAGRGQIIKYSIPKEGSILWVDMMAIPIDAPHADEAYAFINFMQRPEVAAANTNFNNWASANQAADSMIADRIRHNEAIYPAAETMSRLFAYGTISPEYDRQLNRSWTRFRTGR